MSVVQVHCEAGIITCIHVPEGVTVEVHDEESGQRLDLFEGHAEDVVARLDELAEHRETLV